MAAAKRRPARTVTAPQAPDVPEAIESPVAVWAPHEPAQPARDPRIPAHLPEGTVVLPPFPGSRAIRYGIQIDAGSYRLLLTLPHDPTTP